MIKKSKDPKKAKKLSKDKQKKLKGGMYLEVLEFCPDPDKPAPPKPRYDGC